MLINFVLISGKRLTLDCDPNDTIKDILQRIINSFQLQDYKTVKLIYKGKKLNENDEIKTLNYSPNQLVIVHAQDKKKKKRHHLLNQTMRHQNLRHQLHRQHHPL